MSEYKIEKKKKIFNLFYNKMNTFTTLHQLYKYLKSLIID